MRRYLIAYAGWLAGVFTAAGVAYYFYRRIMAMGDEALAKEFRFLSPTPGAGTEAPPPEPIPSPPEAEPTFEDAVPIEKATVEDIGRKRGRAS